MKRNILFAALSIAVAVVSCKKDDATTTLSTTITSTQTLKVKYPTGANSLFRFKDSTIVASSDIATTNWDFGFIHENYTPSMIVNSHSSGPGSAGVIAQASLYDGVTTAPTTGYAYDTTVTQRAVKAADWYTYNPVTHLPQLVTPRTFIFKAADGIHYAKVELLNVGYVNLIGSGGAALPDTLTYKFRYSYQANGSTTF